MSPAKYQIDFLDNATLDLGDLDWSALRKQGNLEMKASASSEEFLKLAPQADVLIVNKFEIRENEIAKLSRLKLICVCATGVNNIDLEICRRHHIGVCNVAGYSTATVVEHTFAFLLALGHRLLKHHESVMDGRWSRSPHFTLLDFPFSDLAGKTLGILGYGHIGKRVAKIAKAFGMKVLVGNIPGRTSRNSQTKRVHLKTLMQKSDFVTLHCPLSPLTQGLIDREKLSWMKPTSYLLNLARGPIVIEQDVADFLKKGKIAGYAADVSEKEPMPKGHPLLDPKLKEKVLLTPHIAWASRESRQRLVDEMAKNIEAFKKGRKRNRVV